MNFKNKRVLITGGSSGIGAATAQLFAHKKAQVYVLDRQPLRYVDKRITWYACDVSNTRELDTIISHLMLQIQQVDYLICNAGIHVFATIEETRVEQLQQVIATNLLGSIYCLQRIIPVMKEKKSGSIVLLGSDQAFIAKEQCAIYGATKAALVQLAKSTALDYASYHIRVNCVCPGTIDTPMYRKIVQLFKEKTDLSEEVIETQIKEKIPLKRIGKAQEVAQTIAFLCSDAASFITGAVLSVDGGYTIT